MLLIKDQQNYTNLHYEALKNNFNTIMFNLANMQIGVMTDIPNEVARISKLTEELSNITIISGNCYFYKQGKDLKVVEQSNVVFDSNLDVFKLKPTVSYTLEPKQGKAKITTDQQIRLYDVERKVLKSIDDLVIKKEPVAITTKENRYKYTINLELQEIQLFNNLTLKLNEETLSYPEITEVYYVDTKRNKNSIKLFNNNSYTYNIDLNKNESNIYSLDFDLIESDNINIVLEDVGLDLVIDSIELSLTEYSNEGYITLEALEEQFPILKVGIEGKASDNTVAFQVSHDLTNWYNIDLSNLYDIDKVSKVVSWNTISDKSIKTTEDVRKVYLRIILKAVEKTLSHVPKVGREIHSTASFSTVSQDISGYGVYEVTSPVHYGEKSVSSLFDFKELYDRGEYCVINNQYFAKGFEETIYSKTPSSPYVYAPVMLKSKEVRLSNTKPSFDGIDISSKNLYTYEIQGITKNLSDLSSLKCVIPLANTAIQSVYYVKQGNKEISIDLSLGYINSALEVLFITKSQDTMYLLDMFKNVIGEVPLKLMYKNKEEKDFVFGASLLDTPLFDYQVNISKHYPVLPLNEGEIGFIDNTLTSDSLDKSILVYTLSKKLLYCRDFISPKNTNYSEIVSEEDYNTSKDKVVEVLPSLQKQVKLKKGTVVMGSISIPNNVEVPFINGYTEFVEVFSKTLDVKVGGNLLTPKRIEFVETEVLPESLTYHSNTDEFYVELSIVREEDTTYLEVTPKGSVKDLDITVSYSYISKEPKHFYSVDYNKGVIYFSEPTDKEVTISYESDKVLLVGKKATQLDESQYSYIDGKVNINNFKDNSTLYFVYTVNKDVKRNVSPTLQDLKVNYITMDPRSL